MLDGYKSGIRLLQAASHSQYYVRMRPILTGRVAWSVGLSVCLSVFGCMTASDTQFDSRDGFSKSSYTMKTQPRLSVKESSPWQPFLAFYTWGAHWRHLKITTEPSMCGGDAALCQITLSTCYVYDQNAFCTGCKLQYIVNDNCRRLASLLMEIQEF